jgi:hypothetical protein
MSDFATEAEAIIKKYAKLTLIEKSGIKILSGEIDLVNEVGDILDTYQLEICPCEEYPFLFPLVFETGGKLPVNIDWHVYEDTGRFCVKIPPEERLICINGITLHDFIKNELIPYLFNQTFRRENGYYINERAHGVDGLIEYYGERLKTNDTAELIRLLGFILYKNEPDRVALCFCGSNKKYRRCHRDAYRLLLRIKKEELLLHLRLIVNQQKK